jgi:hypothetical protein
VAAEALRAPDRLFVVSASQARRSQPCPEMLGSLVGSPHPIEEAIAHDLAFATMGLDRGTQRRGATIVQVARALAHADEWVVRHSAPVALPCSILSSSAGPMLCSSRSE